MLNTSELAAAKKWAADNAAPVAILKTAGGADVTAFGWAAAAELPKWIEKGLELVSIIFPVAWILANSTEPN